jgi:hypothetical protein
MRRSPSTVLCIAGRVTTGLLDVVGRSPNVATVRAAKDDLGGRIDALKRAEGVSAPFAVVETDPLADVASGWSEMWRGGGAEMFERACSEILHQWRAQTFELPDFYLRIVSPATANEQHDDFYLGALASQRPRRVVAMVSEGTPEEDSARMVQCLSGLPQGPWWPNLDDLLDAARRYIPPALSTSSA